MAPRNNFKMQKNMPEVQPSTVCGVQYRGEGSPAWGMEPTAVQALSSWAEPDPCREVAGGVPRASRPSSYGKSFSSYICFTRIFRSDRVGLMLLGITLVEAGVTPPCSGLIVLKAGARNIRGRWAGMRDRRG